MADFMETTTTVLAVTGSIAILLLITIAVRRVKRWLRLSGRAWRDTWR